MSQNKYFLCTQLDSTIHCIDSFR